jgi:hypothetical protein
MDITSKCLHLMGVRILQRSPSVKQARQSAAGFVGLDLVDGHFLHLGDDRRSCRPGLLGCCSADQEKRSSIPFSAGPFSPQRPESSRHLPCWNPPGKPSFQERRKNRLRALGSYNQAVVKTVPTWLR